MNIGTPGNRRLRTALTLSVVVAITTAPAGCGWFDDSAVDATATATTAGQEETPDTDPPPEQVALGEITDPSDTADPDGATPDTTPPSEVRRLRQDIQVSLELGQWRIADQQATAALERTDLEPEVRLEIEAYRDLARAAEGGDEPAADVALDHIERIQPDLIDALAVRDVLPGNIQSRVELKVIDEQELGGEPAGSDDRRKADE